MGWVGKGSLKTGGGVFLVFRLPYSFQVDTVVKPATIEHQRLADIVLSSKALLNNTFGDELSPIFRLPVWASHWKFLLAALQSNLRKAALNRLRFRRLGRKSVRQSPLESRLVFSKWRFSPKIRRC